MIGQLLDSLREPAHTGSRRCWPCTALNGVLVGIAALLVGRRWRSLAGVVVLGVGGLLIALRGYVVPYTPTVAPRIVDRLPVDIGFGHSQSTEPSESLAAADDPEALLGTLLAAGVLVGDQQLYLDEEFADRWQREMATLRDRTDSEIAAGAAEAVPFDAEPTVSGERLLVAGQRDAWLSRPVAIAETAGIEALVSTGLDRETATSAVEPLRMFLPVCPDCGGTVDESTIRNCCGGTKGVYDQPDREVIACSDCGSILYELHPLDESSG
ncbi:hypothetical protein halTADL_3455 [Halohasta litchfieldiae]|jgi:hypothetical protein|uniref:Uncharacterized protein n=1 Tax=Halohasta litchfieldiae TaxID=1073996 RepID=A0A1H6XMQ1_9EURY|nr:hypothetical protein [Halohasta litchfieldiae]ATW90156.1 hypothetical protein halTADL_3455 [Halohasta litchfieldiae]SEJ30353.1 hypothetical protein SAMN05444271_1437 [Halohasta litchfieldiae]